MAKTKDPESAARAEEKKRLKQQRKELKKQEKTQKKEVRKRAKEISAQEAELDDEEDTGGIPVFLVTVIIVLIWIAILCILVKLDVGGIGSNVLSPLLKNVPVINKILPNTASGEDGEYESYGGYTNLKDAVDQIRELELELERAQQANLSEDDDVSKLKAEIARLQQFEDAQTEFEKQRTEFYEQVVYAENGPGAEEYAKYYESMDPANAEYLYQKVVQEQQSSLDLQNYAEAYAAMKPKEAAAIFDTMTDDLQLVAKILGTMGSDDRGKIIAKMDQDTAARVTKIMDPDN